MCGYPFVLRNHPVLLGALQLFGNGPGLAAENGHDALTPGVCLELVGPDAINDS
jgi:hypothetical protein